MSKWISKDALTYRRPVTDEYLSPGITIASDRGYYLVIRQIVAPSSNSYLLNEDCEKFWEISPGILICEMIGGPEDGLEVRIHKSDVEVEWISSPAFMLSFLTMKDRPCGDGIVFE